MRVLVNPAFMNGSSFVTTLPHDQEFYLHTLEPTAALLFESDRASIYPLDGGTTLSLPLHTFGSRGSTNS
jgi:hypothetical protein